MTNREKAFLQKWYLLFGCEYVDINPHLFTTFDEEYQRVYLFELRDKNLIIAKNNIWRLYKINPEIVEKLF